MTTINLTSSTVSGFLETDFDQIKDAFQDGGVEVVYLQLANGVQITGILDEDDMTSDSAVSCATQQSIKKYVDDEVATKTDEAITLNDQTGTTYTLVLTDVSKLVTLSNASAITMTVPLNSSVAYPTGTQILLYNKGAGQVTVAATGGVTIRTSSTLLMREQYSMATLVKIATDEWIISGDMEAA